jgi:transglycosylase-like protein with SLT domain
MAPPDLQDAPVIPLLLLATGGYLAWFGVHYWRDTATVWPSDPVKDVLQGKGLPAPAPEAPVAAAAASTAAAETSTGPVPGKDLAGTAAANRNLGRLLAARYGWATGDDWDYLSAGWAEESGWDNKAQNGTWPGAYGIAQANPGTKYPKAGWPAAEGGTSDPETQIEWGLAYIKDTYGSPTRVPLWSAHGPLPGYQGY